MSFREPNLPNHPMVLPPPDQSILEQEKATVSKELEGQCLEIADAELMLHVWRSHQNWPGKVPIQDQLDYTWRAAEVGTELDFDEIRRMLETYLRDVKFDRGAGVQFPEFDNIQHYINTWTDLTERLQRGALLDWAIHRWYWVVLAAAGLRITKIWAEFKNESKKLADASRRQNPRSVSLV